MAENKEMATAVDLRRLVERQHYRCALSGRLLAPCDAACDHIVPVSQGGTHAVDNLQILHTQINRAKGTMSVDMFVKMCCEVADYNRQGSRIVAPAGSYIETSQ